MPFALAQMGLEQSLARVETLLQDGDLKSAEAQLRDLGPAPLEIILGAQQSGCALHAATALSRSLRRVSSGVESQSSTSRRASAT
jgi:hypothetical protein